MKEMYVKPDAIDINLQLGEVIAADTCYTVVGSSVLKDFNATTCLATVGSGAFVANSDTSSGCNPYRLLGS